MNFLKVSVLLSIFATALAAHEEMVDQIVAAGDISEADETFLWGHLFPRVAQGITSSVKKVNNAESNLQGARSDLLRVLEKINGLKSEFATVKELAGKLPDALKEADARMARIEGKINQLEEELSVIVRRVQNSVFSELTSRLEAIAKRIPKLEETAKRPPVFFDATNDYRESLIVAENSSVVFNNFLARTQDLGFDAASSTFVASKAGTYQFTFSGLLWDDTPGGGPACVSILKNDDVIAKACAPDYEYLKIHFNREAASTTVLTRLEVRDRVRVILTGSGAEFLNRRSMHFVGHSVALD